MRIYKSRTLLVTGSAGFIGSNFLHFILKNDPNIKIVSLDKLTYAGSKKILKVFQMNHAMFLCRVILVMQTWLRG